MASDIIMKLAFCIFRYFPYGGLQRDLYCAVEVAIARGHEVTIYTMTWQGTVPAGAKLETLTFCALTNHARAQLFSRHLRKIFNNHAYDRVIGFNKISDLDVYFTGENCFAQHVQNKRFFWLRFFPRYYVFSSLEKQVFSRKAATQVLLIAPKEKAVYQKFYYTPEERFHFLLPSIRKKNFSDSEAVNIRQKMRAFYRIPEEKTWVLFVASDYALKGLPRVLSAIIALDQALHSRMMLTVLGQDESAAYVAYLAEKAVKTRVDFLGASNEIYEIMSSADLLVHPAKMELAGKVLLEAMINYLPVLTTAICGCASYVAQSGGGVVLAEPYSPLNFNRALLNCIQKNQLHTFRKNLMTYAIDPRIYNAHQQCIDYVENLPHSMVRDFFLDQDLAQHLSSDKKICMRQIFALEGKVYRQVAGRKTIFMHLYGKDYFIKMHYGVGWYEILKNSVVLKSVALGAQQEYKAIRAMQDAKILVPEVCAYATSGTNPAKISSFIITKCIYYQYDLGNLCHIWQTNPPTFSFKRALIQRVAEIARNMHAAGMNHRDFYLCHLLLDQRSERDFDLYLIDLHRVQIRKTVPLRWKIKDLAGLYFSAMDVGLTRFDRFYFLMHYYQLPIKTILQTKGFLWWWIHHKAQRLYNRQKKKSLF